MLKNNPISLLTLFIMEKGVYRIVLTSWWRLINGSFLKFTMGNVIPLPPIQHHKSDHTLK